MATRRISDVIPMIIMHHMIQKLSEDIKLQVRVLCSQPETLKCKFEEDSSVSLKRRMLKSKVERLTNAEKELTKF